MSSYYTTAAMGTWVCKETAGHCSGCDMFDKISRYSKDKIFLFGK